MVNLTTKKMVGDVDYCGVRSGREHDKWTERGLEKMEASKVNCPALAASPVQIECKVREILELGSHHMFVADVVHVSVDEAYMDEKNRFHLEKADPIVYSHGTYFDLGKPLGTFGYSVRKKKRRS